MTHLYVHMLDLYVSISVYNLHGHTCTHQCMCAHVYTPVYMYVRGGGEVERGGGEVERGGGEKRRGC